MPEQRWHDEPPPDEKSWYIKQWRKSGTCETGGLFQSQSTVDDIANDIRRGGKRTDDPIVQFAIYETSCIRSERLWQQTPANRLDTVILKLGLLTETMYQSRHIQLQLEQALAELKALKEELQQP